MAGARIKNFRVPRLARYLSARGSLGFPNLFLVDEACKGLGAGESKKECEQPSELRELRHLESRSVRAEIVSN
jgi:hypothetical protein